MSLSSNVNSLSLRVATEAKSLRTLLNGNALDNSALLTTAKSNLVAAINELYGAVAGASGIDDGTTSSSSTWSSQKISDEDDAIRSDLGADIAAKPDINDTTASGSSVYSSTKTDSQIAAAVAGFTEIDDVTPSTTTVYSSSMTDSQIADAVAALVDGAPGTLDTLNELAAALADDAAFSTTVTTALGNRVRVDTASQGLNSTQQGNARTNIAAAAASDLSTLVSNVGDTTTNYVTTFEGGLS